MSSGWAYLASVVEHASIEAAATPYPRQNSSPGATYPDVRWEVSTQAKHRISGLDPWGARGVSEASAMQVPAFSQGVHILAGTCGAMPLWVHKGNYIRVPPPTVIAKPDPDVASTVHWTRLFKDLVLHPYAWTLVTERLADGFPQRMRHIPFSDVNASAEGIYVEGRLVPDEDVKRFDSPFAPGALTTGASILRTASLIEAAVRRFAAFDIPSGYLKQTGGPDLLDEEIDELLAQWESARSNRSTGFLSQSLDYKSNAFDPKQLQLVEARSAITADVARLLNLPPSSVNAETGSSLTYSTVAQQQEALQAISLWPYLSAVRDRLSMNDILPRGTSVEIPSLGFMRTDLTGRADTYRTLIDTGVLTIEEARALEQLPPLDSDPGRVLP